MSVRLSTPSEQPMQASKWLDIQALLDADEMALLLDDLDTPLLFQTGCVCPEGSGELSLQHFLRAYADYISLLKGGELPEEQMFRPLFSAAMTVTPDVLFAIPVKDQRCILRLARPAVQMQYHRFGFSNIDNTFHPMTFGSRSFLWGIQFSYPQLYQDLNTHEVFVVKDSVDFPNTALFRKLQKWMRQHTIPTPFLVGEQRVNVSMRLGKKCLAWINQHPQLKAEGLAVKL